MKPILLLVSKKSYRAHDFLEAAQKIGAKAVVGSDHRRALEELTPASGLFLDFRDPEGAVGKILEFSEKTLKHPFQAVVPLEDDGALTAALASEALGLPYNPPESAKATRNKHLLRQGLSQAGILQPEFRILPTVGVQDFAPLPFPCILKPLSLSASRGVMRADNSQEFEERFRRLRRILEDPELKAQGREFVESILVESYIPGFEVAVEGILDGGELNLLALFDKPDPLEGPFFEETIYVTPSRLPLKTQEEIVRTTAQAARALKLKTGPVHAELRLNEEGIWPIDIAARSIGGHCSRVLRFKTGMSLEEIILRQALGETLLKEREKKAAGVMMIPIPGPGILRAVKGKEEALKILGIEEVEITIPLGQELIPLPEGAQYLGFIFARGEDPREVEAALRGAHRALHFVMEPSY